MPYGIANYNGQVEEIEIERILNCAYKTGINGIDTASNYGNSEEIIGYHLKKHVDQKWSLITKLSGSKNRLKDQINKSIDILGVKPDAVLAHSVTEYLKPTFWDELKKIKDNFEIEQIGVSVYTKEQIEDVLTAKLPNIIQCPLNILDTRLFRCGILDKLKEKNVRIHIRSVFLQGMFYLPDEILQNNFNDVFSTIKQLRTIAQNVELTLAELSLLWVTSLEQVDKVIIGVDNVDQLITHINTLKKNINNTVFEEALSIKYENEEVLNPSLWITKS